MTRVGMLAVILLFGLASLLQRGPTADVRAQATPTTENGFVGAWRVSPTIGGETAVALTTFNADGTVLTSNRPVQPGLLGAPGVVVQSLGHGSWQPTGDRTADLTFVILQTDGAATFLGTRTIRGSLTLDDGGQRWTGVFTASIAAPDGALIDESVGDVRAERIVVAPPPPPPPLAAPPAASPVASAAATPVAADDQAVIEITGLVARPLRLRPRDLRALPSRTVEVAWQTPAGGVERHQFRGVPLQFLVQQAEPRLGPERDAAAGAYVVVTGIDGYSALVALGEFAPRLGAERVILAWEQDGAPLPPDQAPARLVIPGDQRDERSVSGVVRVELLTVNGDSGPPQG